MTVATTSEDALRGQPDNTAPYLVSRSLAGCPVHVLREKLRAVGLRPTRQRTSLGWLLFAKGDRHISAEILFEEAMRARVPVSLATVYNTLHQFTQAGLLRELAVRFGNQLLSIGAPERRGHERRADRLQAQGGGGGQARRRSASASAVELPVAVLPDLCAARAGFEQKTSPRLWT